jgi:hypothetical protein
LEILLLPWEFCLCDICRLLFIIITIVIIIIITTTSPLGSSGFWGHEFIEDGG